MRDVVEGCGGTVTAENHPSGGAVLSFELPAVTFDAEAEHERASHS